MLFRSCSGDRSEFLAHFGDEFAARAVFQFKRCLDFRNVYAERVFIQFGKSKIGDLGFAPTDFGTLKNVRGYQGTSIGDHFGIANLFIAVQSR